MENLELKLKTACEKYQKCVEENKPDKERLKLYDEINAIKEEMKFIVPIEFDLENQFQLFLKKISLDKRLTDERTIDLLKVTFMAASQQMMTLLMHDLRKLPDETSAKIMESLATQSSDFMEKRAQMQKIPAKPIKQERNKPCICGSGKKYKNCCYLLSSNPIPNN